MKKNTVKVLGLATATLGTVTVGSLAPGGAAYADEPEWEIPASDAEQFEGTDSRSAEQKAAAWHWCPAGYLCFGSAWDGTGDKLWFRADNGAALPSNIAPYLDYCGGGTFKNCASSIYNRRGLIAYSANNYNGTGSPNGYYNGEKINQLNSTLNNNIEYADTGGPS